MSGDHAAPIGIKGYLWVWVALAVLTVVEIGVADLPISKFAIVASLIILALAKAALVGAYFMHLRFERKILSFIVIAPLVLVTMLTMLAATDTAPVETEPFHLHGASADHSHDD